MKRSLSCPAHSLDDDSVVLFKKDFDVDVVDRSNEPFNVIFHGLPENLERMYAENWGEDDFPGLDDTLGRFSRAVDMCGAFTVNGGYFSSRHPEQAAGPRGPYYLFEYGHPDNEEGSLLLLEDEIAAGYFKDDGTFHVGDWKLQFFALVPLDLEDFA